MSSDESRISIPSPLLAGLPTPLAMARVAIPPPIAPLPPPPTSPSLSFIPPPLPSVGSNPSLSLSSSPTNTSININTSINTNTSIPTNTPITTTTPTSFSLPPPPSTLPPLPLVSSSSSSSSITSDTERPDSPIRRAASVESPISPRNELHRTVSSPESQERREARLSAPIASASPRLNTPPPPSTPPPSSTSTSSQLLQPVMNASMGDQPPPPLPRRSSASTNQSVPMLQTAAVPPRRSSNDVSMLMSPNYQARLRSMTVANMGASVDDEITDEDIEKTSAVPTGVRVALGELEEQRIRFESNSKSMSTSASETLNISMNASDLEASLGRFIGELSSAVNAAVATATMTSSPGSSNFSLRADDRTHLAHVYSTLVALTSSLGSILPTSVLSANVNQSNAAASSMSTTATAAAMVSLQSSNTSLDAKELISGLLSSDGSYLTKLMTIEKQYRMSMRDQSLLAKPDDTAIFLNMEDLLEFHTQFFQELDRELKAGAANVGKLILGKVDGMKIYIQYIINATQAQQCLERCAKEKSVASFLKSVEKTGAPSLESLLQLPLTKLDTYLVFLEKYLKAMPANSKDRPFVEDAAYKMADLIDECGAKESVQDNLLRVMDVGDAVEGLEENLVRPDRRFIYEASLKIVQSTVGAKPIADYVFLFNDLMLFVHAKSISQRKFTYVGQFGMHQVTLKGDGASPLALSISVVSGSTNQEYQLVCSDAAAKENWLTHLSKVIRDVERYRKVFGVPLKVLLKREKDSDIPSFVEKAIKFIYDYGLKSEGIFRLSGRATQIEKLRDQLDQGKKVFFSEDMDVHSVAALLKQWLRELPEPLLTWSLYSDFIAAATEQDPDKKLALVKDLICSQLPRPNRLTFQHMVKCLVEITKNEQFTKLNATTLSVVFAPNVLKNGDPNADLFDTKSYEYINTIFKEFIIHYDAIFHEVEIDRQCGGEVKTRKKSLVSESKKTRRASLRLTGADSLPSVADGGAVREGTLWVQEKKKWVQRYCAARTKELIVFKSQKEKKPKQKISLVDCTVASALSTGKPFSFGITFTKKKGEVAYFAASNTEEADDWIQALKACL